MIIKRIKDHYARINGCDDWENLIENYYSQGTVKDIIFHEESVTLFIQKTLKLNIMELKSNTHYHLDGATTEQREKFIKLILEDNDRGWSKETVETFIKITSDDIVYYEDLEDEWEWVEETFEGTAHFKNVCVKDLNL